MRGSLGLRVLEKGNELWEKAEEVVLGLRAGKFCLKSTHIPAYCSTDFCISVSLWPSLSLSGWFLKSPRLREDDAKLSSPLFRLHPLSSSKSTGHSKESRDNLAHG